MGRWPPPPLATWPPPPLTTGWHGIHVLVLVCRRRITTDSSAESHSPPTIQNQAYEPICKPQSVDDDDYETINEYDELVQSFDDTEVKYDKLQSVDDPEVEYVEPQSVDGPEDEYVEPQCADSPEDEYVEPQSVGDPEDEYIEPQSVDNPKHEYQ